MIFWRPAGVIPLWVPVGALNTRESEHADRHTARTHRLNQKCQKRVKGRVWEEIGNFYPEWKFAALPPVNVRNLMLKYVQFSEY